MSRKLILKILIFLGLLALTIAIVMIIPVNRPDHFLLASIDKENRLYQVQSPKIVIVGGSNTIFNVDSEALYRSTGYEVVNMGLHAGLGLMLLLNEIEPAVNSGDVIIIMPEYAQFYRNLFFGGRIVTRILTLNPGLFKYINTRQQYFEIMKGLGLETRSKIVYLLGKSADEETYNRSAFNRYGDLEAKLVGDKPVEKLARESYGIRELDELNREAIDKLNEFYSRMKFKHVKVFMAPPAVPVEKFAGNHLQLNDLNQYLKKNLDIPTLFTPKTALMPSNYFYDTYYHLNTVGRGHYTKILLRHFPMKRSKPRAKPQQRFH